jgi:hypothetical protein
LNPGCRCCTVLKLEFRSTKRKTAPGVARKDTPILTNAASRVPLALRIGVTGSRRLSAEQLPRIREEIGQVLRDVREAFARLSRTPGAAAVYARPDGSSPEPRLRLLTSLAEGADRLVADVALEQGFELLCALPFAAGEYEKDFASEQNRHEFRELLRRAGPSVCELDGKRDEQDRSYEAAGLYVARNCDLLIAVWDGLPARGVGGTEEIVRFSLNHGPPVWWIHTGQSQPPTWLGSERDLRAPACERSANQAALDIYLARLIVPPAAAEPHAHTLFERAAQTLRAEKPPAYLTYNTSEPGRSAAIWRAYGWLIQTLAGGEASPWTPVPAPADSTALYWFEHYQPADAWAEFYARRYRSAYVWVFGLATIAVIFASIALAAPPLVPVKFAVTGVELVALGLIAILVLAGERQEWHRQFIEHRLLAELCRKQQALAPVAWSLPGPAIAEKKRVGDSAGAAVSSKSSAWVSWYFGVLQRAAPLPVGAFDAARTGRIRDAVIGDLIDEQLRYHRGRAARSQRASARLGKLGEWFFFAVFCLVVAKLVLIAMHAHAAAILPLGLMAAILPAVSAGFVGIRAYAELSLLVDQSLEMQSEMASAKIRVGQVNSSWPLASQILGSEIYVVVQVMLQDIQGWAQLFRSKVVEAG